MTQPERVIIVGAGMAGLHAAFQLAEAGVPSLVVDSSQQIGGVVYGGASRRGGHGDFLGKKFRQKTEALYSRLRKYDRLIGLRLGTEVVGPTGQDRQLALLSERDSFYSLDYDRLIVCMGCQERATPFPGWTLPGVMMLGGAQLQVKKGLVKPGKRMVVCGSGPLVPVAALQFLKAGIDVAGIYEANSFSAIASRAAVAFSNLPLLVEGVATLAGLRARGGEIRYGWGVLKARGDEVLEEVVVAPYDAAWRPDIEKQQTIAADSLATGYGFVPRTELTRLLGLEHDFDATGHLVPKTDDLLRAMQEGVYVAGDIAGIRGGEVAAEAGRLAALACLQDMGCLPGHALDRKIRRSRGRMHRLENFTRLFPDFSRPRCGIQSLADANTVICRCENVTRGMLDAAVSQGVVDLTTLKMTTRVGMGECQGRICGQYCRAYLEERLDTTEVGELRPRFPLSPVPFDVLVKEGGQS